MPSSPRGALRGFSGVTEAGSLGTAHPSQDDKYEADRKGQEVWEEVGRELAPFLPPLPCCEPCPAPHSALGVAWPKSSRTQNGYQGP